MIEIPFGPRLSGKRDKSDGPRMKRSAKKGSSRTVRGIEIPPEHPGFVPDLGFDRFSLREKDEPEPGDEETGMENTPDEDEDEWDGEYDPGEDEGDEAEENTEENTEGEYDWARNLSPALKLRLDVVYEVSFAAPPQAEGEEPETGTVLRKAELEYVIPDPWGARFAERFIVNGIPYDKRLLEYDVDGEQCIVHLKSDRYVHTPGEGEPPVVSREEALSVIRDMHAEGMRSTFTGWNMAK